MESIYTPLTGVQYKEMFEVVNPITETAFPYGSSGNESHQRDVIWNHYKIISGDTGTPPCTCRTTLKYWNDALRTLKKFIESVELKKQEISLHITTNPPIH